MLHSGRGRKPKESKRDKVIRCRVTQEFREQLLEASHDSGVSMSTYIQDALAMKMKGADHDGDDS